MPERPHSIDPKLRFAPGDVIVTRGEWADVIAVINAWKARDRAASACIDEGK